MRLDNRKQDLTFEFSISIGGGSLSRYYQQSHCAVVLHVYSEQYNTLVAAAAVVQGYVHCCCCNESTGNEEASLCHGAIMCDATMMKLERASAISRSYNFGSRTFTSQTARRGRRFSSRRAQTQLVVSMGTRKDQIKHKHTHEHQRSRVRWATTTSAQAFRAIRGCKGGCEHDITGFPFDIYRNVKDACCCSLCGKIHAAVRTVFRIYRNNTTAKTKDCSSQKPSRRPGVVPVLFNSDEWVCV